MTINDCTLIELPTFKDHRGCLTLIDDRLVTQALPFKPQRCFWLHSLKADSSRGEHAHRTCWELLVAINGSFNLTLHDGKEAKTFCLDSPTRGVVIPPMVWCKLWNFSEESVCYVIASEDYTPEGYINDFQAFLKEFDND